jgi:alkyl sulfatase BDS1-like metallo-beta-lactamase superfamily hydrolase
LVTHKHRPKEPRVLFEDEPVAHVMCGHRPTTVHPRMAERSNVLRRRIFEFAPDTFAAIEYVGSSVMVVGSKGAVVVGCVLTVEDGQLIAGHFDKLRQGKPIKAVIYSDSLVDVYGGVAGFISTDDAKSGAVSVIAHESFEGTMKQIGDVGNLHALRTAYHGGYFLEKGPEGKVHMGTTADRPGKTSYVAPNLLVGGFWKGLLGGVQTEIYHFPAESDDGIVVYFPKQKMLVVGHVLFGDVLPNVYSPRGVTRDPKRWYKGIEGLIDLVNTIDVEYMIPHHFQEPIVGRERIMDVLIANRDTLQYISDQTARFINKGYRPDDLATAIKLPPHLATHQDLQEHYGRLQQHLRQQYYDHIGWFHGDPTFFDPISDKERARHYVDTLGGRGKVLEKVSAAIQQKQALWAAELLTWLIIDNPDDGEARQLKADMLRQLGYAAPNPSYRNWFLTSALELEGKLPASVRLEKSAFVPVEILMAMTPSEMLEALKARLMAEKTLDLEYKINIRFDDDPSCVSLIIRRGVLETRAREVADADASLRMTVATLGRLIENQKDLAAALANKVVVIETGDKEMLMRVEACFEPSAGDVFPVAMPTRI